MPVFSNSTTIAYDELALAAYVRSVTPTQSFIGYPRSPGQLGVFRGVATGELDRVLGGVEFDFPAGRITEVNLKLVGKPDEIQQDICHFLGHGLLGSCG